MGQPRGAKEMEETWPACLARWKQTPRHRRKRGEAPPDKQSLMLQRNNEPVGMTIQDLYLES